MKSLDKADSPLTRLRSGNGKTQRELLDQYIEDLEQRGFFGQVVLKFENGKVVYYNEHRGRTPEELSNELNHR